MHYYIVTGASSGLGKETARLLLKPGHHIVSVSRKPVPELSLLAEEADSTFTHVEQDLSKIEALPQCVDRLMEIVGKSGLQTNSVCLIHNAANAAPFQSLHRCSPEEIEESFNLNLLAPALLSSMWIKRVQAMPVPKKLVFITSGSAEYPMADMSLYCSAKAGLNMLARCLQTEEHGRAPYGVQIAAVDPGMMDTPMQAVARAADERAFPAGAFFRKSHQNGHLRSPQSVARALVDWLCAPSQWAKEKVDKVHRLYQGGLK